MGMQPRKRRAQTLETWILNTVHLAKNQPAKTMNINLSLILLQDQKEKANPHQTSG